MAFNIPETDQKRVVIIGAGFGGLKLARKLKRSNFQVVLIDKNNFHQFQPLFYQVATAGLEPSSISFPLRKMFQKSDSMFIRLSKVERIDHEQKRIYAELGYLNYDYLVSALGATTNYYGNEELQRNTLPMKSIGEALLLRNTILTHFEKSISTRSYSERQKLIDVVVVGGGATGVEVAGALGEMKKYILPKDYKELSSKEVDIYLVHSGARLLPGMSEKASRDAEQFLVELGVHVIKNTRVTSCDGEYAYTNDNRKIEAKKVIWAAGIVCPKLAGTPDAALGKGNRLKVNSLLEVEGMPDVFAIGDQALVSDREDLPFGHPQVAQVAIQMAKVLAANLKNGDRAKWKPFRYKDLGSMATVGRNRAVCDLPKFKFSGFFAWLTWLFVHLMALVGVKNKVFVFINWFWSYITYDQSLRLIIRAERDTPQV